ncbi:MAG: hypothetical protein ACYCTV_00020 [Leptospirales bacterium]
MRQFFWVLAGIVVISFSPGSGRSGWAEPQSFSTPLSESTVSAPIAVSGTPEPVRIPDTAPLSSGQSSGDFFPVLDLDRGIVRSVHLEEAWVENAVYLHSINEDNLSAGHSWQISGEMDFAFNQWLGGELDFPVVLMTYPLGQGPAAFGPITLGLRVVPFQIGSEVSRQAGILSFELEGSWWGTPQSASFPGIGDSVTPEILGAWRYHHVYFQGITGYTVPVGFGEVGNTFLRTSIGRTFQHVWAIQLQDDVNTALLTPTGQVVPGFSVIPELAYMPFGDLFLNEVGEGMSVYGHTGPQPTTYFLMEYEFRGF